MRWSDKPSIPAKVVTAAEELPINAEDLNEYGWNLPTGDDWPTIQKFVLAGVDALRRLGGPVLVATTLRTFLDVWPCDGLIVVPHPPLLSVVSIAHMDGDGDTQTLDASDYQVDVESRPGRILPAYGTSWPTAREQLNAITIEYTAGFGSADDVPQELKVKLMQYVVYRYENRDQADEKFLNALLAEHWHGWIF